MKTIKQVFILLIIIISASSCNIFCEEGNGKLVKREFTPKEFKFVSSKIASEIEIVKAASPNVILEIDENLVDLVEFKVENSQLNITSDKCFRVKNGIKVTVFTPVLEGVAVYGIGDIRWNDAFNSDKFVIDINGSSNIFGEVNTKNLIVKINGSGDVKMKGDADLQEVKIKGSGDYLSELINGNRAEIVILGSGDVSLGHIDDLEAKITGSGNIYYKGNPVVRKSIKGSGDISRK